MECDLIHDAGIAQCMQFGFTCGKVVVEDAGDVKSESWIFNLWPETYP